jgi:hypothetical protein
MKYKDAEVGHICQERKPFIVASDTQVLFCCPMVNTVLMLDVCHLRYVAMNRLIALSRRLMK